MLEQRSSIMFSFLQVQTGTTAAGSELMVMYRVDNKAHKPFTSVTSVRIWLGSGNGWSLPLPIAQLAHKVGDVLLYGWVEDSYSC